MTFHEELGRCLELTGAGMIAGFAVVFGLIWIVEGVRKLWTRWRE